jgi:hypothetical protein
MTHPIVYPLDRWQLLRAPMHEHEIVVLRIHAEHLVLDFPLPLADARELGMALIES